MTDISELVRWLRHTDLIYPQLKQAADALERLQARIGYLEYVGRETDETLTEYKARAEAAEAELARLHMFEEAFHRMEARAEAAEAEVRRLKAELAEERAVLGPNWTPRQTRSEP